MTMEEQQVPQEKQSVPSDERFENEELTALLKRVQADFENYRKRIEEERRQVIEHANADLLRRLLPLVDSSSHALGHLKSTKGLREGLRLLHAQFLEVLRQEGVTAIDTVGKRFDPTLHEVLLKEHSDQQRNIILEELQKGYLFKGKVLRHSRVKLSSGPAEAPQMAGEESKVEGTDAHHH